VHDFSVVGDTQLHYVRSVPRSGITQDTSLVIFLHGFPDSWQLWQHYMRHGALARKAVLIAVDLPGFGGSDSLPHYGPDKVLTVLAEFIMRMREQYLAPSDNRKIKKSAQKLLIVAHDWGAILAFRLAAEAPQLADRYILSNAVHPPVTIASVYGRLDTAKHMLRSWAHHPRNLRLLGHAYSNLKPLLVQVRRSAYVFAFRLHASLASLVGAIGDYWFLRLLNAVALGDKDPSVPNTTPQGFELLASYIGPGPDQFDTRVSSEQHADGGLTNGDVTPRYSESVRRRAATAGWMDKTALYRDGCFSAAWTKPIELVVALSQERRRSSSSAALSKLGPDGALEAPVTFLFGAEDVAIENCLALDGLGDYFWRGSQLVKIKHCGHWTPLEYNAIPVFEAVIDWALEGEKVPLRKQLAEDYPMAAITVEK
jgi:pimeloyl-ACP methyl ester carboxylesterase